MGIASDTFRFVTFLVLYCISAIWHFRNLIPNVAPLFCASFACSTACLVMFGINEVDTDPKHTLKCPCQGVVRSPKI